MMRQPNIAAIATTVIESTPRGRSGLGNDGDVNLVPEECPFQSRGLLLSETLADDPAKAACAEQAVTG